VAAFTAFYDASVLYPSELRNLLMHLTLTGLCRAKWSAAVHEEWIRALLRNRADLTREKLERTRMLMDKHATDAVVTGYEELIEGLRLPDPDDRHVLAADRIWNAYKGCVCKRITHRVPFLMRQGCEFSEGSGSGRRVSTGCCGRYLMGKVQLL
jgi:hypothetical protein